MMKRIERARLELERVRLKVERIRQERRFYKQILSCNQKYGNRWVEPTKKALEVLPFRVKTYPWKVLSVHERTIVVEQVSKVGTTYPVTYHKSFMQDIITKETLL